MIHYPASIQTFDLPEAELVFVPDFLPQEQADCYFNLFFKETNWRQDEIMMFGKKYLTPRLQAYYADENLHYSYSGVDLPINKWYRELLSLKENIEVFANHRFNACLFNLYRSGQDSNGWHQDNEKELGENPIIASLSLGQDRKFKFKHISKKEVGTQTIELPHGSLLLMSGSMQHHWKHCLPKTKQHVEPRINLTFRNIITPVRK